MKKCLHCGEKIDIGGYKDEDEKEDEFDTFDDGEVWITLGPRQGFRESGSLGGLHTGCFDELFGEGRFDPQEWGN